MSKGRNSTFVGVRLPDDVVGRLKVLARQRRKTMSDLLRDIIGQYTARRYSPGRPRRQVNEQQVSILSSVPGINSAGSVAAVVTGGHLTSEVERLEHDSVASSSPGASVAPLTSVVESLASGPVASQAKEKHTGLLGDRYPGTARGAPCPCGSGEKYKRCCGKGAPPQEL